MAIANITKQSKNRRKNLKILEINSGKKVFDWKVPDEWTIKDAWIKDSMGKKIIDFSKNNLHLMGYSSPIHQKLKLIPKINTFKLF